MNPAKQFFYHAHGSALGGVITRPIEKTIEDSASATSLPLTGGHSLAKSNGYKLQHDPKDIISHTAASTEVSGRNETDGSYTTEITSVVEGLNVYGVVTADRIVAHLTSKHNDGGAEGSVVPTGSGFLNLKISDYPVEVELDPSLFVENDTIDKFKKKHKQDAAFRAMVRKRFLWGDVDKSAPDWLQQRYKWVTPPDALPESKGIVPCSLVKSIKCNCPGVQIFGNVIIVPEFGKIFLGEILLKEGARRLTMMRLEMGSPVGGSVVACDVEGNGTQYP
jgi:hypothetical protein